MLKPKEKEGARGICRCKSPAQIHKPYLFLTLSTAFLELANHSAAQVAQCAFLESWEQLAGALSTRDRTFAFAYLFFFFHQEKQVRESPGLGGWEAEGKNPFGPSLGNRDRSLLIVLVRQTSQCKELFTETYTTRIRKHPPSPFLLQLNLPSSATLSKFLRGTRTLKRGPGVRRDLRFWDRNFLGSKIKRLQLLSLAFLGQS